MPMKRYSYAQTETSVRKEKHEILASNLERAEIRDKFPSLNVIQTGNKNERSPNAPPYDQRSTELNEDQEEFAGHAAYKLHKELFKIKEHHSDVHRTIFFRSDVPSNAIPKKLFSMSTGRIVTHDGAMHRGLRHARRRSTSRAWRLSVGYILWQFHCQCRRWEDYAVSLVYSYSWPSEGTLRLSKGKQVIECSIENFVLVVAVTTQKVVPSIEF